MTANRDSRPVEESREVIEELTRLVDELTEYTLKLRLQLAVLSNRVKKEYPDGG